jgi:isoquinoline 1-oxidoreductase subunit beta
MKRRTWLLAGAGAAGVLVVGWSLLPPRQRLTTAQPLPVRDGQFALNGWVKIGADDTVGVVISKSEMGQGVFTGLAMLAAEELDADWSRVRVEAAPIDTIYNNVVMMVDGLPFHPDTQGSVKALAGWMTAKTMREIGAMVTGGSTSIKDLWLPMREAGAAARAMLIGAAAAQWKVAAAQCSAANNKVTHPSGKSATFGELAALAAKQPLPGKVALKDPAKFKLIGQSLPRIEAASKTDGSATFGIDVRPAGLKFAAVKMCPTLGGKVVRFDGTAATRMPGVMNVIGLDGHNGGTSGVAVIADTWFQASSAVAQVNVDWDHGPAAGISHETVYAELAKTLDQDDGFGYHSEGDVEAALKGAAKTIHAEYRAPYLAHATMEPMNCTVQVGDGKATVWASTQVPGIARSAVAKVLGIDAESIDLQVQLLGGGFGRRLDVDFIAQAAAIARDAGGVPVQTIWSREQDMTHDFFRPACVSRFTAGFDATGNLVAWRNASAGQAIVPNVMKRAFGLPIVGPDKTTSEGAFDQPYEWPNARIGHAIVDLPVPIGFWRSVGHSHQAFFKESFIDEAAAAVQREPVGFRRALLRKHPRHLAVLERAAELSRWGTAPPPAPDGAKVARGFALHQSFGAIVAQVAEVSVAADKTIRVHRVICVIDCGQVVNPNLVKQQMESAIVFGLSAALYSEIKIDKGQVQQSNFHDYPVLRMSECPAIETDIIASRAHPEGVGEPGTPPIAPAVANAIFALTGQRLRSLPLRLV